ncbi:MAG TPA: hypothetical protein VET66_15535 [Steroidobacteraceae bacterium]|nr:hypothetical protein [Steroidobacteraceae bacterium]
MDDYFAISGCAWRPASRASLSASERLLAGLRAELDEAARALVQDGDLAALLLDGLLSRVAGCWYARHVGVEPEARAQLADLSQRDAPFARRLRLALRAPDAAARLAHARALLAALGARGAAPEDDSLDDDRMARAAG